MKITIEYESDTIIPEYLENSFIQLQKNIRENKYEHDKIQLDLERFRGNLLRWLSNNMKRNQGVESL